MNLTLLKAKATVSSLFFFAAILMLAIPAMAQTTPCSDQSPRNLTIDPSRTGPPEQGFDYNFVSGTQLVTPLNDNKVLYQRMELVLCDRHYHSPDENLQGCHAENPTASQGAEKKTASKKAGTPPIGSWVEVHSVYAAERLQSPACDVGNDHDLKCCAKPPFVVLGYTAQIAQTDRIPTPVNFAEWTGSATSETATKCNTTPARWRFALGCDTRLTQATLEGTVGGKEHEARDLQGPNLVSPDLTFVNPNNTTAVCRKVSSIQPIPSEAAARTICPGVCKWPLNQYNNTWSSNPAQCGCCPLQRPQSP